MQRSARHTCPEDHQRARELRCNASPYERKLWKQLSQNAATAKLRFRRQQPIPPYIADFACMRAKLLIELDGTSHEGRAAYDAQRTAYLEERGYTVLRFGNKEIDQNLLGVVKTIIAKAIELTREAAKGPPTSKN